MTEKPSPAWEGFRCNLMLAVVYLVGVVILGTGIELVLAFLGLFV